MRRRKNSDSSPFDTLRLEGNLFIAELLERAARGDAAAQKEADYGIPKGLKLHDEYGRSYRIATALWKDFTSVIPRTDVDAHSATLGFVGEFLRECLGYADLALLDSPQTVGDRGFPISAISPLGHVPVIVAPHSLGLDEPDPRFAVHGAGARKKSAHQLAQEFLNASKECLWAIVTNGKTLRLLRDAETLTRPNFLEFDLETILREGEDRYADFSALWRILHSSRSAGSPCVWEKWKSEGQAQGLRVREGLRDGVHSALVALGTGFISHPANSALRERLHDGTLTPHAFFQQLLRLIYRFIVLATLEERDLLHAHLTGPESEPARKAYLQGYSLRRLRQRTLRRTAHDRYDDLWRSLRVVFKGLANGEPALGLPGLGGLYAANQCPDLDSALLTNAALLEAQFQLRWSNASGSLAIIDYRNMGTEELGSVYESLLELVPALQLEQRRFYFLGLDGDTTSTAGNARKITGSHYTPDALVQELVRSVLDPLIAQTIAANRANPVAALLKLTICDPACGSGHFLLAAARRLAEKIAELRAVEGAVTPGDYRRALREVISHCIHGVDRNPMAVELARTALWLEGFEPGKPLSFLDHHLLCGDALLGIDRFSQIENGIPDAAFKPLSSDHAQTCTELSKLNKAGRKELDRLHKGEKVLFAISDSETNAFAELAKLEALPEETAAEVEAKAKAYGHFLEHARDSRLARAADCFIAAFLAKKEPGSPVPTSRTLLGEISSLPEHEKADHEKAVFRARSICRESLVLHWPLAFPHVFARGGFDCILANPPWERIKLQEEEFFATREPLIAGAKNKAERGKRIQWLAEGLLAHHVHKVPAESGGNLLEKQLYQEFIATRRLAEAASAYAHLKESDGARFPLTGVGDVNTYALFAEAITRMTSSAGRAGFIVPTGIATDDSTKAFFGNIATSGRLASLYDFENSAPIFPGVHRSFKFSLLTLGPVTESQFSFFLTDTGQLTDEQRRFSLTAEDFRLINPNTLTCPVFRSRADAELTRAIYRKVPVLIEEPRDGQPGKNPWGIRFMAMMHMSNDSGLFRSAPGPDLLPLYEAKMIHQFDHRWASYGSGDDESSGGLTPEQKRDPACTAQPRYWVHRAEVDERLLDEAHPLYPLFAARLSKERTALAFWFRCWLWGHELLAGRSQNADRLRKELDESRTPSHTTMELLVADQPERQWAEHAATEFPLTAAEQKQLWEQIDADDGLVSKDPRKLEAKSSKELSAAWETFAESILPQRDRQWLMGWRRNARASDERTMIAGLIPRAGVGDSFFLFSSQQSCALTVCLLGALNSLVFDFIARQKVGGVNFSFYYIKQLPVLPPSAYNEADLAYIVPRVLELTYTAHDLGGWAKDVVDSWNRAYPATPMALPEVPYTFDLDRRALLRAELDALYARLYGLTRDQLRYILDPADTHGPDYPSETFRVLKNNETRQYGEYRTHRLVLEAWDLNNT